LSDSLSAIPDIERWDLVVSNPPHFKDNHNKSIKHFDKDWEIHNSFYTQVGAFLNPGASILIQENFEGSDQGDFNEMIASNGLTKCRSFVSSEPYKYSYIDTYYFVCSMISPDKNIVTASSLLDAIEYEVVTIGKKTDLLSSDKFYKLIISECYSKRIKCFTIRGFFIPLFIRTIPVNSGLICKLIFLPGKYFFRDIVSNRKLGQIIVV